MTQTKELTPKQISMLDNLGLVGPYSLKEANPRKPFIYDRERGFYYCQDAHVVVMSLLLAFDYGLSFGCELKEVGLADYPFGTADVWLSKPGRAFKSSIGGDVVWAGFKGNLSDEELELFGKIKYILQEKQSDKNDAEK